MKSKNIVFVLNEYNGHGGAQRVASILADDFLKDGHNVAVLSINEQENEPSYFSADIPVHIVHKNGYRAPIAKEISSNLKALRFNKVASEVKRRIELVKRRKEVQRFFDKYGDEDVYVIIIQVWGMQWIQPVLYRKNVKIIGQSHESVAAAKNSHRYKRLLRYYRQVSKFLLLTQKDSEYFANLGFTNAGVMYNPSPFRSANEALKLYSNKTIVSTGRLIEDKGFDVLIESFSRVAEDIPGWKLEIYGEGPAKKSLQSLINVLDMNDRIHLKGQTGNVQEVLESASFFVLSSKAEGLPMSLIEAQSCGLPCISTDCAPGIREIIDEYENGYLAPVGDVPVLSRHIRRLAQNEDLFAEFSEKSFSKSEKFEKSVIKQQWYDLFDELGGGHGVN
ncbi:MULTISPECIES: glycosyltransferase [Cytobacillus]|uniref:glycosyltransferase n=1 Tax=Cytobacillus TaxID=2675230 RepID=UPI002041CDCF|nr:MULTISPECIES: glycosyltransferase [Cytobacillus]MBY0158826.1 glycosyltransferase [Cytobacillus firmus]MCM3391480.1 glycosyltransferase [Cytobacillus oceanisediminis]MCM3529105.1 glycosyltransferase [Cytobacillus oceanisediminis]UQX53809.1 glycosyltransferase [Cytobacillus pseudoceanisediminis]USK43957.1 glycosyltransferase [Cytobacillus oceanisediminis]